MDCEQANELMGAFVDGELTISDADALEAHLADCACCQQELSAHRQIASKLSVRAAVSVPDALWPAIERRMSDARNAGSKSHAPRYAWTRRQPLAWAAVLFMAAGVGLYGLVWTGAPAIAAPVNFRVLLDALPLDAPKAMRKFLVLYGAKESSPVEAMRFAPNLNFHLPEVLPCGYRLDTVYTLRFGEQPGVAAKYVRGDQFLAVIFHRPVEREDFGTHRDRPCVVGQHRGHSVQVGRWNLVHLRDATMCHCILSTLDEESELPGVMAAVAPGTRNAPTHPQP